MAIYNGSNVQALRTAIESVLNQEFIGNVESRLYLAIDGPVSFEINETIKHLKSRIFTIHRIESNGGLATALNSLIKLLQDEEFIFRMDADDFSYLNRYQLQIDYFKNNPSIDILGTDIIEVDAIDGSRRLVTFCRGPDDAIAKICKRVPIAHPTACFKRRVFDRVGGYPSIGTNEDVALWFRCLQEGFRFDNVRQPLLEFSIDSNFWKRRSYKKAISEFMCYIKIVWEMDGFSWKYIFPLTRFFLRISPTWVSRWAYKSKIRQ